MGHLVNTKPILLHHYLRKHVQMFRAYHEILFPVI
jgi:hypothetical protein